jgi:hypothetical protein
MNESDNTPAVLIPLTRGRFALVDAADEEAVLSKHWCASHNGHSRYYVRANVRRADGSKVSILLHRFLLDAQPGEHVDHINGDTLDNRRSNLRLCSNRQNHQNMTSANMRRGSFKGVTWSRNAGKWMAQICAGPIQKDGHRKRIYLGYFSDKNAAARAYDAAALEHFGEFAALNFPR